MKLLSKKIIIFTIMCSCMFIPNWVYAVEVQEKNTNDLKSSFSLREYIDFKIENQGKTNECWAFSILNSMESNLLYKQNKDIDFSERHMDYATSNSFKDIDKSSAIYSRDVKYGALPEVALAYLTNGQGAVLEEEMPFENNDYAILYSDINIKPSYYVKDYIKLPSIFKTYNSDGSVNYFDNQNNKYNSESLKDARDRIKKCIVENGSIASVIASEYFCGYNSENTFKSTAYCCKDITQERDHAVSIIGWDDNYSKENFTGEDKPQNDGAYLVLQTYGEDCFDNGYMYVSYEDVLIETSLYCISNSSEYNYDNLYQNDYYGPNVTLTLENYKIGYFASSFDRNPKNNEKLTQVSFALAEDAEVDVYINPKSDDLSKKELINVGNSNGVLQAGYHTIEITPTALTGEKFAVVIKQRAVGNDFMFNIEYNANERFYSNVNAEYGKSKISVDGKKWVNLKDSASPGSDLSRSDVCIKAFTVNYEPEKINSEKYIIYNQYIKNIEPGTTIKDFLQDFNVENIELIIKDDVKVITLNSDYKIKTGMKLKINNEEYDLVVKGDISGDGKISLLDLSKLLSHYGEIKGFELNGPSKEAGDINLDNKVSLVDLSKLLVIYSEM